jgi:hypothetical protein
MAAFALLRLASVYPHETALARRIRPTLLFPTLRQLEAEGLALRRRGLHRLTSRGRAELELRTMLDLASIRRA